MSTRPKHKREPRPGTTLLNGGVSGALKDDTQQPQRLRLGNARRAPEVPARLRRCRLHLGNSGDWHPGRYRLLVCSNRRHSGSARRIGAIPIHRDKTAE
jgi:hypothetical protein